MLSWSLGLYLSNVSVTFYFTLDSYSGHWCAIGWTLKFQCLISDSLVSHWVNDNKVLNTKTLPWLAKILGRRLKKILQKYVTKIK